LTGDRLFRALLRLPGAIELAGSVPHEAVKLLSTGGEAHSSAVNLD
jgi:hypothetical protein